jgi:hypothetical protein
VPRLSLGAGRRSLRTSRCGARFYRRSRTRWWCRLFARGWRWPGRGLGLFARGLRTHGGRGLHGRRRSWPLLGWNRRTCRRRCRWWRRWCRRYTRGGGRWSLGAGPTTGRNIPRSRYWCRSRRWASIAHRSRLRGLRRLSYALSRHRRRGVAHYRRDGSDLFGVDRFNLHPRRCGVRADALCAQGL